MTTEGIVRDQAMEDRVARTLEEKAAGPQAKLGAGSGTALVVAAHRVAMEPRRKALDAHHPEFLHPGRTALILVLDCGYRDPVGLAAAALLESERPDLRVGAESIRARVSTDVADLLAGIPLPGPGVIEALLGAGADVRRIALAERLDHCRHARFWEDRDARRRILEEAETAYGPVAERSDPELGRRFAHWAKAFRRSLERA